MSLIIDYHGQIIHHHFSFRLINEDNRLIMQKVESKMKIKIIQLVQQI